MEHIDTVILGAGFGGLGMGAQMVRAGHTQFAIFEKANGPGGTWRENTYPGAACDTEAHLYCYSFELHTSVSRMYAGQQELLGYAERIVKDFGLNEFIRYQTEIVSADWDESTNRWVLTLADGTAVSTRVFIAAWGQLNRPAVPFFDGLEDFRGPAFHSAEWRHDVDLTGKRVASIGNAASAVQYVPEVAKVASKLDVFQRSPNWIMPRNQIIFTAEELEGFENDPELFLASRRELHEFREAQFARTRRWSEAAQEVTHQALEHLAAQVPDPVLREKLTPDFPLACKRVLRSDDYYPALMRENVELVTEGIERIVPDGIITKDGVKHEYDVIIFGTGFETQSFQGPVDIFGRGRKELRETWRDGAEAYLGMTVSGFPNFFMIYGPNTNLGHNSVISMLEIQQNYILGAIDDILSSPGGAIDVRRKVMKAFNEDVQKSMDASAWAGNCNSWYKNAAGRVVNNWSGTVDEYRAVASVFRPEDFERVETAVLAGGI
jgi:cation diffusion facilitator CzcD-associated flavoprotein CzcO